MSNAVFANCNEISCKAGAGKVIASFPDVCLSPPSPPAGPIPIPYPVSSFSSDAKNGSKNVKINGKEIMLKDKSYFSKCTGDEAATKTLGMGVVTHNITGKVYYCAWSMDVKVEGLNVDRHLDLTTSNHMSPPGNTPPMVEIEGMSVPADVEPCKCKYKRPGKEPGEKVTPNGSQTSYVNQPGKVCWICKQPAKTGERMIADHQPSLAERWYTNENGSGCKDGDQFKKNAVATPGDPAGSKEYNDLLPRCMSCFETQPQKAVDGTALASNITGRTAPISEGGYESMKSSRLRKRVEAVHGVTPVAC